MDDFWAIISIVAVICGFLGALIGSRKQAGATGFWLGFLFGPLGVIASFAFDGRNVCPKCGGRLNGRPKICEHCRSDLSWEVAEPIDDVQEPEFVKDPNSVRCPNCGLIIRGMSMANRSGLIACPACNGKFFRRKSGTTS